MKPTQIKNRKISKKQMAWLGIAALIVALAGWWTYTNLMPKPLGNELEYLGKKGYGCVLVCDSNPTNIYYYGTSLTPNEVAAYFKSAKIENGERLNSHEDASIPITFSLKSPKNNIFYITYHTDSTIAAEERGTPKTHQPHVIEILDSQYQAAKDSL